MPVDVSDVFPAQPLPRVPVRGGGLFPVHRIYCIGRNFAEHVREMQAREMGANAPTSNSERGQPIFFLKPADSIVTTGIVAYPPGTTELHHEVELVVALGRNAPAGVLDPANALGLVFGYAVGLDLTRRDLQSAAKAKGLPWDTGKSFDDAAPISDIIRAHEIGDLRSRTLSLTVNGAMRQSSQLDQLIWDVPDVLHELSKLYALRAGDLIFMGTPAGVAALRPGDECVACLDNYLQLRCRMTAPRE